MRFHLTTDDGVTFAITDTRRFFGRSAKVFASDVPIRSISAAIERRLAGDLWREAVIRMLGCWTGHQNQWMRPTGRKGTWEYWINVRLKSFNNRGRAVRNSIRRGSMRVRDELFMLARAGATMRRTWELKIPSLIKAWDRETEYGGDEWSKWCVNTAGNGRKRQRFREERASAQARA
jgi:hypothetical protein